MNVISHKLLSTKLKNIMLMKPILSLAVIMKCECGKQ